LNCTFGCSASSDIGVDVDLSGHTILAGQSFVVNSNYECGGAFPVIYGREADLYTTAVFGDGDDRYILTDAADGSNLLDIYGEFGVDGTAAPWEYTNSYAYRLPAYNVGSGQDFASDEWFFGGKNALATGDPTQLLLDYTTPAFHVYDEDCTGRPGDIDNDNDVDVDDYALFQGCLAGPGVSDPPPGCDATDFVESDLGGDNDVDLADFEEFQAAFEGA